MAGKPRVSLDKWSPWPDIVYWLAVILSPGSNQRNEKNIKQAVIEAKRVADQLQVMAGQLDRLANQIW